MPISVANLAAKQKDLTIDIDGDALLVVYRPAAITPESVEMMSGATTFDDVFKVLKESLISWDLLGTDGAPLPIEEEALRKLPLRFLSQVTRGMMTDVQPGEVRGGSFGGGSPRKGR